MSIPNREAIAETHGIKVTATPEYQVEVSKPSLGRYLHSYTIQIENLSAVNVQLISRHWIITDGDGLTREVVGDGVVGKQPILYPEESHTYNSWCPIKTPIGKMGGTFTMMRLHDQSIFKVVIPEFNLIADFKLN